VQRPPARAVGVHLQQAALQVRVPREPRDEAALGAVRRDARQRLGERRQVRGLEDGGGGRGVAEREGVRGRRGARGGRAEGADAAAGGQHRESGAQTRANESAGSVRTVLISNRNNNNHNCC